MAVLSKGVTFRVTEELHKEIRIKLAKDGITLQDYLTKLVEEDFKKNKDSNK